MIDAISIEKLKMEEVRTLTTGQEEHNWRSFNTFMETLKPKTSLELSIHFDEFTLKKDIAHELHINGKQEFLRQIPKICSAFAEDSIEYEIAFFKKYNNVQGKLDDVLMFYDNIKHDIENVEKDSFLLHFAWGTGWYGTTVGRLLDSGLLKDLRLKFEMGKNQPFVPEFPKTRKLVFENGTQKYPLGWVKLRMC